MDRDYRKTAAAVGYTVDEAKGDDLTSFPIEKARLRSIWYFVAISTACTIGYGWTLQTRTVRSDRHPIDQLPLLILSTQHLAAPLILQFICGLTVTGTFNVCNTLIVDLHPDSPATASASVSIVRCSVAAIGVSILQFILDGLGPGWTFTLFGALGGATAPMLWAEWHSGMAWRNERRRNKVLS